MLSIIIVTCILNFHAISSSPVPKMYGAVTSEMPSYSIVALGPNYEIRRYGPQLWAQVDYTVDPNSDFSEKTSTGFQYLFQYITGSNERQEKIPMTAPVIMQQLDASTGRRRMAFIMPASLYSTRSQLPTPKDGNVKLVAVDQPAVFACTRFNMNITDKLLQATEAELRQAAALNDIVLLDGPESVRVGGYNPPGTLPVYRTNDICIPLANQ